MSRKLIDRDALIASIPKTNVDIFENCRNCTTLCDWQVKELIDKMPTIDAVEVVRCKDCKNLDENDGYFFCNAIGIAFGEKPNWFCADGERKEQDDESIR